MLCKHKAAPLPRSKPRRTFRLNLPLAVFIVNFLPVVSRGVMVNRLTAGRGIFPSRRCHSARCCCPSAYLMGLDRGSV